MHDDIAALDQDEYMISTPYYQDLNCDSSPYVMHPPPNHRPASYLARKKVLRDGIWRDPEEVFLLSNPYPVFSIGLSSSFLFSPLHLFTSSLLHLLTTITTTSPLPRLLLHQHNNQRKNDGAFSPVSGSAAVSRRPIGILLAFLSIRDSLSISRQRDSFYLVYLLYLHQWLLLSLSSRPLRLVQRLLLRPFNIININNRPSLILRIILLLLLPVVVPPELKPVLLRPLLLSPPSPPTSLRLPLEPRLGMGPRVVTPVSAERAVVL